jgi:hypothetical protein
MNIPESIHPRSAPASKKRSRLIGIRRSVALIAPGRPGHAPSRHMPTAQLPTGAASCSIRLTEGSTAIENEFMQPSQRNKSIRTG